VSLAADEGTWEGKARVYTFSVIVPDAGEGRVLLMPATGGRWSLPAVVRDADVHPYFEALLDQFREQLGLDLAVRRVASLIAGKDEEDVMVLACENRRPESAAPAGGRWATRQELAGLDLAPPEHGAVLAEWFDEVESRRPVPALRVPWARAGWLAEAEAWVRDQLTEHGLQVTGPVAQVKAWSISCILRAPTEAGPVYFKAVPPLFAGEPTLTAWLSRRYPGQVPEVLALDPERRWLLLLEIRGAQLPDLASREEALRRFARLQIDHVGREEDLLAAGVVDRRLAGLTRAFDQLLEEIASPERRAAYRLSEEDSARVAGVAPGVKERIAALAAAGVPETLIHGDLHDGNILADGAEIVFFDWTDAALAHPFFDLHPLFHDLGDSLDRPGTRERLRDAYLEPWAALLPRERLLAAFALSQQVGPLYHALSYRYIVRNTEPALQWNLSGGIGGYLRALLEAVP
jgi:hypothetical protein